MEVSIIIPVYNVEQYIQRCIESVIAQTYTDIECILVFDGCTDKSEVISNNIINRYDGDIRFKVLKNNTSKGVSAARNTGINNATGNYLFFLDSDDFLAPKCIELLYDIISSEKGIEMSIGEIMVRFQKNYYDQYQGVKFLSAKDGIYRTNILDLYLERKIYIPPVNKLFRKDFITNNNLFFEEGLIHEDYLWSFQVACSLKTIAVTTEITYTYFRHKNSIDSSDNTLYHILNYSKACMLQAKYAYKSKKLRNNSKVYHYIHNWRYGLITNAYRLNNNNLCKQCYTLIRNAPSWNIFQLISCRATLGELILSFHSSLPYTIGYKYYMLFVKKNASQNKQ